MKSRPLTILMVFAIAALLFHPAQATPQKKKKAGNAPPTVKLEVTPVKDPNQQPSQTSAAPAQTNSAAKPGHGCSSSRQPRKNILELRKFYLQLTFPATRALSKDVENQLTAIQDLDPDQFFEIS